MRQGMPLGVYVPGSSVIHRTPPAVKLLCLVVFIVVVSVLPSNPVQALVGIGMLFVAYAVAGIPVSTAARQVVPLLPIIVFLCLFLWWQNDWVAALTTFFGLAAAAMAAVLLTLTTTVEAMLDSLERGLAPLARVGVRVDLISLAIALTIRVIPLMFATIAESLDARKARGAGFSISAVGTPVVIRSIRRAQLTGEALLARGAVD